jgi:hypothetical protein
MEMQELVVGHALESLRMLAADPVTDEMCRPDAGGAVEIADDAEPSADDEVRRHDAAGSAMSRRRLGSRPSKGVTVLDLLPVAAAIRLGRVLVPDGTQGTLQQCPPWARP